MDERGAMKPKKTSPTRRQMLRVLKHCGYGLHHGHWCTTCFDSEGTYGSTEHYGEGEDVRKLSQKNVDWARKVLREHGWDSGNVVDEELDALEDDDSVGYDGVEILHMVLQGCQVGVDYVDGGDGSWAELEDLWWDALSQNGLEENWDDKSDNELKEYYDDVVSAQNASGAKGTNQAE